MHSSEPVVERLSELLNKEGKFLSTLENAQVRRIVHYLRRINAFLSDAKAEQRGGQVFHQLLEDFMEIAGSAQHVIESHIAAPPRRRSGGLIKNIFTNIPIIRKGTWLKAKSIENRILEIYGRARHLVRHLAGSRDYFPFLFGNMILFTRNLSFFVRQYDFVGSEDDIEMLVKKLVSDDEEGSDNNCCRVVSIHGPDGLGKTTIARKIYNHSRVKAHFEAFAWVPHVSAEECEQRSIIPQILSSLDPPSSSSSSSDRSDLRDHLIEVLRIRTCLVVVDDVLCADFVDMFKDFNQGVNKVGNSRILMTTQDKDVHRLLNTNCFLYEPPLLNEDQSWELMMKVFPYRSNCLPSKKREMMRRCKGLPLAVVVLGRLLETIQEWWESWENWWDRKAFDMKGVDEILRLSFDKLPNNMLKQCFVSLGNLPYKFDFDAEKLLQWWMAENAISLYVAESYLKELARRSMVEVKVDEYTGRAKTFRLHNLFRHLCLTLNKEAGGVFEVVDLRYPDPVISSSSSSSSNDPLNKERRLAYYLNNLDDLDNYIQPKREIAPDFHSVVFYVEKYNRRSRLSRTVESQLCQFKLVRVLDLGGLVFSKLDEAVGKLKYLIYLGLRYSVFHELPSTIGNIENLETLDLWDDNNNTQYASIIIPNVLKKMKQLRHLYLRRLVWSNEERNNKMELPGSSQLETLANFDSRVFSVSELSKLTHLRELEAIICKISDLVMFTDYLQNHPGLWRLALSIKYCDLYSEEGQALLRKVLSHVELHELSLDGRTGKLPEHNSSFSRRLTKITLESCELKDNPMATLEKLSNLQSLFLKWNAFVGVEIVCTAEGFPQLRTLQLRRIRNLEKWRVDEGAMPNLSCLDIISCPNLKMVPDGLQFVRKLKRLVIKWMPKTFTNRLQAEDGKEGEDFYKVQHASIHIIDYNGKETTGGGGGPCSRTTSHSNTRPDKGKGKAPMTESESYSAESSMVVELLVKEVDHETLKKENERLTKENMELQEKVIELETLLQEKLSVEIVEL